MTSQYLVTIQSSPGYESEIAGLGDITKDIKIEIDSMLPSLHLFCSVIKLHRGGK
jgi:hypothetical protein